MKAETNLSACTRRVYIHTCYVYVRDEFLDSDAMRYTVWPRKAGCPNVTQGSNHPSHACPSSSFPPTVPGTSGGVAHQPCTPPRTIDTAKRGAFGTESSRSGESCQARGPNLSASRASLQNNSNSVPRPRPRPRLCLRFAAGYVYICSKGS